MKKFFSLLVAVVFALSMYAVDYHFQEGFASPSTLEDAGWTYNCTQSFNYSMSLSTYVGALPGDSALTFNNGTINGTDKSLETPVVNGGVGTLSFWLTRSSNATPVVMHIDVYKDGAKIKSKEIDAVSYAAVSVSTNKNKWSPFTFHINEPGDNVKIVFWAESLGATPSATVYLDDVSLTKYDAASVNPTLVETIDTDFTQPVWGTPSDTIRTVSYRTLSKDLSNGFRYVMTDLSSGSAQIYQTVSYPNCLWVDRYTYCGAVELPTLKNIGDITILASSNNNSMQFRIEELVDGMPADSLYGSPNVTKTVISSFTHTINRNAPVKLRISSITATNSPLLIYKIKTTPYTNTGIDEVQVKSIAPITIEGRNLLVTSDATTKVEVFSISGVKIVESYGKVIPLNPGFYVVRTQSGETVGSSKILIK